MDRYGEAIEADLADRGLDLLDFFRGARSWRQLLVILDHLPRASRFRQAAADDDEWAEGALAEEQVGRVAEPPTLPLSEFTREVELLSVVAELLQSVNANIRVLAHDKNPPRVQPMPRPRTALDRARDRRRAARFAELEAEVAQAQERFAART